MSHVKGLLAAGVSAAALAIAPMAHGAQINCEVLEDGAPVGTCAVSTTGVATFNSTTIANFSDVSLAATGVPVVVSPDLSTVTLDTTSATFTGTHTLEIDIFQSGISAPAGTPVNSTFTINHLIGAPLGAATLDNYSNGTSATLGTVVNSATFPAGQTNATVGPSLNTIGPAISADAEQFIITFTGPDQSANDTIQLQGVTPAVVPEPASLALLATALTGLGVFIRRRSRKN